MGENGVKNEFEFSDDYKRRFCNSFRLSLFAAPWPMALVVNCALLESNFDISGLSSTAYIFVFVLAAGVVGPYFIRWQSDQARLVFDGTGAELKFGFSTFWKINLREVSSVTLHMTDSGARMLKIRLTEGEKKVCIRGFEDMNSIWAHIAGQIPDTSPVIEKSRREPRLPIASGTIPILLVLYAGALAVVVIGRFMGLDALLIALVCIVVAASVAMAILSKQMGTKRGNQDFYFYLTGAAVKIMLLVCYFVLLKPNL